MELTLWQLGSQTVYNKLTLLPAGPIKPGMEIITADGKRAGYVAGVASGAIISNHPRRRIPLSWIRRIDHDVFIAPRFDQLDGARSRGK